MAAFNTPFAVSAERWLDEVIVQASSTNLNGDVVVGGTPPAGVGDLAIMEIELSVEAIATMVTNPELQAVRAEVLDVTGSRVLDIIGVEYWKKFSATALAAYLSPDPLVLWRQNELLEFKWPELDTNASPTDDLIVVVKCVRVRPLEAPATPLQLVR